MQMQQAPKEEGVTYLCVTDVQITDRKMGKPLASHGRQSATGPESATDANGGSRHGRKISTFLKPRRSSKKKSAPALPDCFRTSSLASGPSTSSAISSTILLY